jgi:hypothetical protein
VNDGLGKYNLGWCVRQIDVFVDNHFCQIGINLLNPEIQLCKIGSIFNGNDKKVIKSNSVNLMKSV